MSDRPPKWGWFVSAVGLLLLLMCGLSRSVIAFGIGFALLLAGLIVGLLAPYLTREPADSTDGPRAERKQRDFSV